MGNISRSPLFGKEENLNLQIVPPWSILATEKSNQSGNKRME